MSIFKSLVVAAALVAPISAFADQPVVEKVRAIKSGGAWTISVTLSHPDTGWDHYADGWEVLSEDGTSLGIRELTHPHVNEQPFTRSLPGVNVPDGTTRIGVRARDLVHGWGDDITWIDLN